MIGCLLPYADIYRTDIDLSGRSFALTIVPLRVRSERNVTVA